MIRSKAVGLGVLAALLLAPAAGGESHQEAAPQPPPFYYVWTDHVAVADAAAYEAALAAVIDRLKATEEGRKLRFVTLASPQSGYSSVVPLADLGDLARANRDFLAATEAVGGMDAWNEVSRHVSHGSAQLLALRLDLSYLPAEPRAVEATGTLRWYDWWYAEPGEDDDLEAVARRFVELAAAKGSDTGWRVYQALTGEDLPLYMVVTTATDVFEYHANEARIRALMGEAGDKLLAEANACTRRLEHSWSVVRRDLSMDR